MFNAKDIKEYPVNGMDRLFLNKKLTEKRNNYFGKQNKKQKKNNYKFYVRKNVGSNKIQVKSVANLNDL